MLIWTIFSSFCCSLGNGLSLTRWIAVSICKVEQGIVHTLKRCDQVEWTAMNCIRHALPVNAIHDWHHVSPKHVANLPVLHLWQVFSGLEVCRIPATTLHATYSVNTAPITIIFWPPKLDLRSQGLVPTPYLVFWIFSVSPSCSLLILNYSCWSCCCMPVDNRNGPFIMMVKATNHKATKTVDDKIFTPSCFQVLHVG